MSIFLSLGSLILGIIACMIPIMAITYYYKKKKVFNGSLYSLSCCSISLVLQIYEIKHRVDIEDFSAIMDTIGAIASVSVLLIVITFLLNMIVSYLCKGQKTK